MSVSLPSALISVINSTDDTDPCLILLEITVDGLGSPIRLVQNEVDITWNSQTWVAFPFEFDTVGEWRKNELPKVVVRVSNVARAIQGYIDDTDGGIQSEVVVYVVHGGNLGETTPLMRLDYTVISTTCNHEWVTFSLSSSNTFTRRFPKNKCLKNVCRFRFKDSWCKYAGVETECDRSLTRCRALGNSVNFGGFPGVGYRGLRLSKTGLDLRNYTK